MINKNLLLKFCEDAFNENLELPYSIGDYTCATNGIILIRIPRLVEYPENPKAPDPEKIEYERNPEKWYSVGDIKKPKSADCVFCKGQGKNFTCPECDGNGIVWLSNNYSEYPGIDCNSCNGKGKIKFCEECNGTGKVFQQTPMDFHGVAFDQRYLALLSGLPNCEIGLISKTATTPFRFDGGTGIIMPMKKPEFEICPLDKL